MGIREIIAGDLANTAFDTDLAETPATEITWDPDDANITCAAIVGSATVEPGYDDGEDHVESRLVTVQTADIADPQVGTFVAIDSVRYKVISIERAGFGSAAVRVKRIDFIARAHTEHTKRMV